MIFSKTITDALNAGYEICFSPAKNIGMNVLKITLYKDGMQYKQFVDVVETHMKTPELIDRSIRYGLMQFGEVTKREGE